MIWLTEVAPKAKKRGAGYLSGASAGWYWKALSRRGGSGYTAVPLEPY